MSETAKLDRDEAVDIAESYYDSPDADNFYSLIWGGEDIHVGLYEPGLSIAEASHRTVLHMLGKLSGVTDLSHVLDIGSGYGGAARVIAKKTGAHVTCLNLSKVENARNETLTRAQGLQKKIAIQHGSFEQIPVLNASYDFVWSQDAILHSANRDRVLDEVLRVLKPGGSFIFTDPMQKDGLDDTSALQPIYDRLHLPNLASIGYYRDGLVKRGMQEVEVENLTHQLGTHYARVAEELQAKRAMVAGKISDAYCERMLEGLNNWVKGEQKGLLSWAIMHFRKVA